MILRLTERFKTPIYEKKRQAMFSEPNNKIKLGNPVGEPIGSGSDGGGGAKKRTAANISIV